MRCLAILRRDLLRLARTPGRTALNFAIPLVIAATFVMVFGGNGGDDVSVRVLVYDEDEGLLTNLLQGMAGDSSADARLELVQVGPEGFDQMDEGDPASALIHFPADFTSDFLNGRVTTINVVKNPSQRFLPQLVQEGTELGGGVLSIASRVFRPELASIGRMVDAGDYPADAAVASTGVGINQKMSRLGRYLDPPLIELETTTVDAEEAREARPGATGILSFFLPGLSVMAVLFLAQSATRDIIRDREQGLLRHLLTAPVSAFDYLVGKALSVVVVTALGFVVMVVLGMAAGVDWGPPLAAALLILAGSIGVGGTLLLIMSLVRTERQGGAVSTIVILLWCMVGGAFAPLSQLPTFLLLVSRTTLVYWCVDGFNAIMLRGGSLADVVLNLVVLTGCGLLFLGVGMRMLARRTAAGVV